MHYQIKKGSHYTEGFHFGVHFGKRTVSKTIKFHSTCLYNLNSSNQYDINKLYGFSEGYHHHNSARFGWRCDKESNLIELLAYVYVDGKRIHEWEMDILIRKVKCDSAIDTKIEIFKDHYLFSVVTSYGTSTRKMPRGKMCIPIGYDLFPYFGGNCTAPQNMFIELD